MIGTTLAHYRITAALGAGGMGEVWRATDTKLGREVALKVLPEEFAKDPARMARFEREAKVLASLNHPNIATLYGLETTLVIPSEPGESRDPLKQESDASTEHSPGKSGDPSTRPSEGLAQDDRKAVTFLAMELVDGEDLSERIKRGAVPVEEAIAIALQIAEGLEAAHEQGIVHRDLKPANIKITDDGTVKVLDFGLAKTWQDEGTDLSSSFSPTITRHATVEGVILGTAAYMSPEQARGKKVDKRADIWAFGVVLWEMLTGRKLFEGETASDVMAAILTREPDLSDLPQGTPTQVRRALGRCLQRDPRRRIRDMGDLRFELEEEVPAADSVVEVQRHRGSLPWIVAAVASFAALALGWFLVRTPPSSPTAPAHLALNLPQGMSFEVREKRPAVAISPAGDELVLNVNDGEVNRLYRRPMSSDALVALEGTEGARAPFFSPDGRWIGFTSSDSRLKKVSLDSEQVVTLAEGDWGAGSWGEDGMIAYTPNYLDGLWRVPAAGGTPEEMTSPDPAAGELNHSWPDHVPGTDALVFTSFRLPLAESRVELFNVATGERRLLVENAVFGRYVGSGHLLFVREGVVHAAPFDRKTLELAGPPVPVLEDAFVAIFEGNSQFDVSDTGTLIHAPASLLLPPREMVWIDRLGEEEVLLEADRPYSTPSLSPDGSSVAVTIEADDPDLWIYHFERQVLNRLTFSSKSEHTPVWFPDGRRLAFVLDAPPFHIYSVSADGGSEPTPILETSIDSYAEAVSPDGRSMVVRQLMANENYNLGFLQLGEGSVVTPIRETRFSERFATLSPDGRFVAFETTESGRREIVIQSFPDPGVRVQVTRDGGEAPLWAGNLELFFWRGNRLFGVPVATAPELSIGEPVELFSTDRYTTNLSREYDVSVDGQRVLLTRTPKEKKPREAQIVLNWFSELEQLAGPGGSR